MKIKMLFGLGNPGEKYEYTNHNVGTLFIDYLAKEYRAKEAKKSGSSYYETEIGGRKLILMKADESDLYMNEIGIHLKAAIKKFNLSREEILAVHDDSDLPLGKYKHSFDVSSAGHRGVQSIIDTIKSQAFHRIRIGIRTKPGKALEFVLKKISKKDKELFYKVFEEIRAYLEKKITEGAI